MKSFTGLVFLAWCGLVMADTKNEVYLQAIQDAQTEGLIDAEHAAHLKRPLIQQQTKPPVRGPAGTAVISGTVTDSMMAGVQSHSMQLYLYDGNDYQYVTAVGTDASGNYQFDALAAGNYVVTAGGADDIYLDYVWDQSSLGQLLCGGCLLITDYGFDLADAAVRNDIDFSLVTGGTITGQITDQDTTLGVSTFDINMVATTGDNSYRLLGVFTDTINGLYEVRGIPTGDYRMYLGDNFGGNLHIPEVYGGPQCNNCYGPVSEGVGTVISVVEGVTTPNIDFAVELGASISGFLIDQLDIQANYDYGLIMIFDALNYNLAAIFVEGNLLDPMNDGSYTVGGLLPGSYYVQGGDLGRQFYQRELYESIPCPWSGCNRGDGIPVVLGPQQQQAGINIQLNKGGKMGGRIYDQSTGLRLAADPVRQYFQVHDASGAVVGGGYVEDTSIGDDGTYRFARSIEPGNYYLRSGTMFSGDINTPYVDEKYPNVPCPGESCELGAGVGSPITVTLEAITPGIDLALTTGNSFSGTITELGSATPIPNVYVLVYTDSGDFATWAETDVSGNFTVSGLPNGTYYALTNNGSNLPFMGRRAIEAGGWVDILYNNLPCPGSSCDVTTGTPIVLPTPPAINGLTSIDFQMSPGASIAGQLIDRQTQAGIEAIRVNIFDDQGNSAGSYETDSGGNFITTGLPAGTYYVSTESFQVLVDQVFGGGRCDVDGCDPLSGVAIVLADQEQMTGIDFIMDRDYIFKNQFE